MRDGIDESNNHATCNHQSEAQLREQIAKEILEKCGCDLPHAMMECEFDIAANIARGKL